MIVVRLYGGLGNQLFQYAAGRRLAARHSAMLLFDTSWFESSTSQVPRRKYQLLNFLVEGKKLKSDQLPHLGWYVGRFAKRLPLPRALKLYRESTFEFDARVLELPDDVFLDGYWQSESYFADFSESIRKELTPQVPMNAWDARVSDLIENSTSVAVHVRRGDYVTAQRTAMMHGVCPIEYYEQAIALMKRKLNRPVFFVFSDDPDWTAANLRDASESIHHVCHNLVDGATNDLRLMSRCQHQIIANSTLSWWAAWLNRNPEKTVIAPSKWFRTPKVDARNLIPATWIKL